MPTENAASNDDLAAEVASVARAGWAAECDRICGEYAAYHKDRCPLYKANCAAMDAMNRKAK